MNRSLLVLALLGIFSATAFSQSPAETKLYEKLTGPESALALETVLKKPDEYTPTILFFGAGIAFKEKRLEDSAFLLYAAQLRVRFDQQCFPPQGQGGDSPLVAFGALSQHFGSEINPAVMAQPKVFAKVVARVKKWTPQAASDYEPGYEYTERKTQKEAEEAAKPNRADFLERMGGLATLLNDAEYFAAFRTIQAYNSPGELRPSDEANDKATETMIRIEKERKIKGVFSE